MKSIWITSIGGDIAQAAIRIIRLEFPDAFIIGSDAVVQPFFSKFVDKFILTPAATAPNYISIIDSFLRQQLPDVFLPISEPEISTISHNSSRLTFSNILISNDQTIKVGLDKWRTYEFISNLGNFAPHTALTFNPSDFNFPIISKPRSGRGSKNLFLCESIEDINYVNLKYPSNIFQELLQPGNQEITCGVYRTKLKKVHILQMKRKLVGGRTSWAEVIFDPQVEQLCYKIAEEIMLEGPLNIQLILTSNGPKVFEMNPRYSSTLELRHSLGFKDLVWGINEIGGLEVSNVQTVLPGSLCGKLESARIFEVNP